jgi:hypothetical protein
MIVYMNPLERILFKGHERLCVTPTDLAYAAGIIDGEGCLGIYPRKNRNCYATVIKVEMCETACLDFLQELFGGYRNAARRPGFPTHRICHQWACQSKLAADCATLVLPYLRIKREQAQNIIELQSISAKMRAGTSAQRKARNGFMGDSGPFVADHALVARCRELCAAQHHLNARGLEAVA